LVLLEGRGTVSYKKARSLTKSFIKPTGLHRAQKYAALIEIYTGLPEIQPMFSSFIFPKKEYMVVNINSKHHPPVNCNKAKEFISLQKIVLEKNKIAWVLKKNSIYG